MKPMVRCKYPMLRNTAPPARDDNWDPTEEELDALIAERMKNLPPWWDSEYEHHVRDWGHSEAKRAPGIRIVPDFRHKQRKPLSF